MMERFRPITRRIIAATALLALAACQQNAARDAQQRTAEVFADDDGLPAFALEPITREELDDFELEGDRRCAFAENPAFDPLLVATGFVRSPGSKVEVLVKLSGQVSEAQVVDEASLGLDAVIGGGSFDSGAAIIDIARIDQEPDGSGPAAPDRAMIRLRMAGQDPWIGDGYWTCDT